MKKGVFFIPIYKKNKKLSEITDEIKEQTILADKFHFKEAFFGEHITDQHEKIASSLLMASSLSTITRNIQLGTLTMNLNFYHPSVAASLISLADNLSKGRLILGIGCGANQTDIESIGGLNNNNYEVMLESYNIIKKILINNKNFIKSKNFLISTKKTKNKNLGLGYFNGLYNQRKNLEIIMPALNPGSYNVKLCATNKWSIAISNFCSDNVIDNHIENYLKYSPLKKKEALKKIRLTKLIFVTQKTNDAKKILKNSPFEFALKTIYKKLKFYKKDQCFGENSNFKDVLYNTLWYGDPNTIKNKIKYYQNKFGELGSIIYVSVPKRKKIYDKSLELFAKYV